MLPENYRAWVWQGGELPSGLVCETLPLNAPGKGEVLVRNEAIGLNPVDWKLLDSQRHAVPGVDGAGTVVAVGDGVAQAWLGQRVAWHQSLQLPGSFAHYTALNARVVMRIPPTLDTVSAAAFPCPGLTAWQALEKVPFRAGDRLLIGGAGGSVGTYLVQLARQRGFEVHTLSHPRHHGRLTALGASHCYAMPDSPDHWAPSTRFDAIIDTSDPNSAAWLCRGLRANGHFVAVLGRPEQWPNKPFAQAFSLHEVALGALHTHGDARDWQRLTADGERMLEQLSRGVLCGEEIITFSFDALNDNLEKLKQRNFTGKLVGKIELPKA